MNPDNLAKLEGRVVRAAEAALADHKYVTAIDVLAGIGWLPQSGLDLWRQGRTPSLEAEIQAGLAKISAAMRLFRQWAERSGLKPSETVYVARTRDRRKLRFSVSGDPAIERAYRTHWVSPELSEAKRQRGLGDLVFLSAGDAALTRRAKKASGRSAVVVRFSRARKRYERQGLLVEEAALLRAREESRQTGPRPHSGAGSNRPS